MTDPATWLRERADSYDLDARRLTDEDGEQFACRIVRDELYACAKAFETDAKTVDRLDAELGEQ